MATDPVPTWRFDHKRSERCGAIEAILCSHKSPAEVAAIAKEVVDADGVLLATRATDEHWQAVAQVVPDARWEARARCVVRPQNTHSPAHGLVYVVAAGTADIDVAEEAHVTARLHGSRVERLYDVGVAGLHRLLPHVEKLREANAIVVAAGMEGALASVVAGLVPAPVVAVPTSVGYGACFGGVAALLGMLTSCAPGVAVVNIDNGYGAGTMAHLINMRGHRGSMR